MILLRFKENMKAVDIAEVEKVHVSRVYKLIQRFKDNIKRLKENDLQDRDDLVPHPLFKYKKLKS